MDNVEGGDGDDRINVRDKDADTVDCGPGDDTVKADVKDTLTNCEHQQVKSGKAKGKNKAKARARAHSKP